MRQARKAKVREGGGQQGEEEVVAERGVAAVAGRRRRRARNLRGVAVGAVVAAAAARVGVERPLGRWAAAGAQGHAGAARGRGAGAGVKCRGSAPKQSRWRRIGALGRSTTRTAWGVEKLGAPVGRTTAHHIYPTAVCKQLWTY